jgi:hypothetical protein
MDSINPKATMAIRQKLRDGEVLLWSGQPQQGIIFRDSDVFLIPFSLLWTGFVVFWERGVIKSGSLLLQLLGIPFVLVGIYVVVGRFFLDSKQRKHTFYGITNQSIIIISGIFSQNIKYLDLKTLSDITLTEKCDKSGTISFGPANIHFINKWYWGRMNRGYWGMCHWFPGLHQHVFPCFELIDSARDVYEKIRGAQNTAMTHRD